MWGQEIDARSTVWGQHHDSYDINGPHSDR